MTRSMSPSRRARIFEAHKGKCHICGEAIDGVKEPWEVEHVIPYALTRDDSDENLAPAHRRCHATKTPDDVKKIAKAKRVANKHKGAHRPKSTLPGSRGSKYKRKINGPTVLREE